MWYKRENPSWYPPNPWYRWVYSIFWLWYKRENPSWYPQNYDVVCYIAVFFYYIIDSRVDIIDSRVDIIDSRVDIIVSLGDIVCYILCDDLNISLISHTLSLLGERPNTTVTLALASPLPCCTRATCLIVTGSRPVWQNNSCYSFQRHVAERRAGIMNVPLRSSQARHANFTTMESESAGWSESVTQWDCDSEGHGSWEGVQATPMQSEARATASVA